MIAGTATHKPPAWAAGRTGWAIRSALRHLPLLCGLIAGLCGTVPRPAVAQVPPGATTGGNEIENRRQLERIEREQQRPAQQGPSVVGPSREPQDILKPGGPKFLLRHIEFDDSKFLTKEELEPLAAPLNGRKVDFSDLQKLIAAINELYAKKNIPTGIATLPPQDVKGGATQTRPNYIMPRVQQTPGEVLDVPRLARDVTWFNRTSDPQIRALLQPGTSFGLTDVELATTEAPAHTLQFFTDNQGVKSTGRYQGGVYYKSAGALGFDDRFTFYGTTSQGNLNGSVSYNVPVNYWGGRLGVSYTQGAIRTVDGPFRALDITGESQVGSVNFSQPVFVTDSWLVLVNAAQSLGKSDTWLSETKITDDRTQKTTAGVSVTQSGTDYSITLSPAFNYVDSHSEVTNLNRYFNVFSATANLLVRLPANFSFSATGNGQYTQERLLPGDQLFQIGGPTTIRGYPTNAVAGDSGYYVNYELHNNLTNVVKGLDVYAFIDMGEVFSTFPARTALYSAGFGLAYTPHPSVTFEGSVGVPWNQVVADQIPGYQIYFRGVFRPLLLVL
jgi:hemolysin activation/secretion protein